MAQLKGKGTVSAASSGQKSAFVMWRTIEIDSTIPWVGDGEGALVGGGRRKEGRKQRSLGPPEKVGRRKSAWSGLGAPLPGPVGRGVQRPRRPDHQARAGAGRASVIS